MNGRMFAPALLALALASPAWAQQSPAPLQPSTMTVVTPLVPPTVAVTEVIPGVWQVTPIPGTAMTTQVRVQNFRDYDLNRVGSPGTELEFAL